MSDADSHLVDEPERPSTLLIGEWLVQPRLHRMRNGDEQVQMEPRLMRVLMCLVDAGGEVVSRNELLDSVWPEAVVCEEVLTQAVSELRRFFGDKARTPRYIETIRKGGYRLVAPIAVPPASQPSASQPPAPAPASAPPARRPLVAVALLVTVLLGAMAIWHFRPTGLPADPLIDLPGPLPAWSDPVPLTSYPGREATPALSPDGTKVAFSRRASPGGEIDIYVKTRGSETPVQVSFMPGSETSPVWSPDGSRLACLGGEEATVVYILPAAGGEAHEVFRADMRIEGLDWSPDGKDLAVAVRPESGGATRILALSLATGRTRPLTRPPFLFAGDSQPRYSPDGTRLAFVRRDMACGADIHITTIAAGDLDRLTSARRDIEGLDWSLDGRSIVFAAAPTGRFSLWRVAADGGECCRLDAFAGEVHFPTIAAHSGDLAFESLRRRVDIHRLDIDRRNPDRRNLGADDRSTNQTRPVIVSSRRDYAPDLSPDGRKIVFLSDRSGHLEIWTTMVDGTDPEQRSEFGGVWLDNPRWSADGGSIAFNAAIDGNPAIYLLDEEAADPRRLTPLGQRERFCCWSADGQWLYFAADPMQTWQIYRMRLDGSRVERISTRGGLTARVGPDGETLYFSKPGQSGLWTKNLLDGAETRIADLPAIGDRAAWAVGAEGVYFMSSRHGVTQVQFLGTGAESLKSVAEFAAAGPGGISLVESGNYLLLPVQEAEEGDLLISSPAK